MTDQRIVRMSEQTATIASAFEDDLARETNTKCCLCFHKWWNFKFVHQHRIAHVVEKTAFHATIVVLVLFDCLLVIGELLLDFIILKQKNSAISNQTEHGVEHHNDGLHVAAEILHIGSIGLLGLFVFEVMVKIYAFGKTFWNFRERKMEWLDAIIVIVSFTADVYFNEAPNEIGEFSLLFIAFRLWRIVSDRQY
jgi:voltage-gated hydrogen channel 1